MKDICIYAILYQYQMQNCKEKALEIFLLAENSLATNLFSTYMEEISTKCMIKLSFVGTNP